MIVEIDDRELRHYAGAHPDADVVRAVKTHLYCGNAAMSIRRSTIFKEAVFRAFLRALDTPSPPAPEGDR